MRVERINGFKVYLRENGQEAVYRKILLDYLNHSLKIDKIFKDNQETKVFLINSGGGAKNLSSRFLFRRKIRLSAF